jgi:chromatin modification-related protein YNG2
MSTPTVQNLEEAATIASEFIATLENIPSEVQFLLQELRTKETQSQELQQEIAKDSHRCIRHTLRTESETLVKDKPSPPPPTEKIKQAQKTLATLADEKIALAERIVEILLRKRSRLDYDLGRVLVLQGEPDAAAIVAGGAPSLTSASTIGTAGGSGYVLGGRNPAAHINESLRNAFAGGASLPVASSASVASIGSRTGGTEESAYKKRKLTATQGSIKLPSPAPSLFVPSTGRGRRKKRGVSSEVDDFNLDFGEETQLAEEGEGEEGEGEDGEDGEDKELYCFCQKLSYGEMIACDNPDCPYQWFHLPCVNLKQPLPESWFCAECTKRGMGAPAASGPGRKGRKK